MITFTEYYSQEYFHMLVKNEKKKMRTATKSAFQIRMRYSPAQRSNFWVFNVMLLQKHQWTKTLGFFCCKRIPVSFESVSVGKCTGHVCPVSSNICWPNCEIYWSCNDWWPALILMPGPSNNNNLLNHTEIRFRSIE
jgi:hypothetical protein